MLHTIIHIDVTGEILCLIQQSYIYYRVEMSTSKKVFAQTLILASV